eukprot:g46252.t1
MPRELGAEVAIAKEKVLGKLRGLKVDKTLGPHPGFMKEKTEEFVKILVVIFQESLELMKMQSHGWCYKNGSRREMSYEGRHGFSFTHGSKDGTCKSAVLPESHHECQPGFCCLEWNLTMVPPIAWVGFRTRISRALASVSGLFIQLTVPTEDFFGIWDQGLGFVWEATKTIFNPQFGSIFRTHHNPTYFSRRLSRFADIYMASLSCILNYNLHNTFYPRRTPLQHEASLWSDQIGASPFKYPDHGFMEGKFCLTNQLEFFEDVMSKVDNGDLVDLVHLDFQKAFDNMLDRRLTQMVRSQGVKGVGETTPGISCPVLVSLLEEGYGKTGGSSEEVHLVDSRDEKAV